jgi:MerR family transcriptional regulator, light-induced transcriptional regulator
MYNLNPNTLRTWERRYEIVKPRRSEGGHRGYGEEDLANIEAMLALLREGHSPAEAASLTRDRAAQSVPRQTSRAAQHRSALRKAVEAHDIRGAASSAVAAITDLGYQPAVESVLFPELCWWGEQWKATESHIAEEHLATLAVRIAMASRFRETRSPATGPCVTLACVPGELHDLALLHVANLMSESTALRPTILAAGLPIAEIVGVANRTESAALVLSATITPRPEPVRAWIGEISAAGWEERTVLVGAGFAHSRIFSESRVKASPGSYAQFVAMLGRMAAAI